MFLRFDSRDDVSLRLSLKQAVFVIRQASARLRALPSSPLAQICCFQRCKLEGKLIFFLLNETSPELVQLHEVCLDVVNLKI